MADFFRRKIREMVGTVFLAAEGAGTLPLRIEAAKRAVGITERLPIATISAVPNLADPTGIQGVIETLRLVAAEFRSRFDVRLGLVIIDTVAAAFSMDDENSNSEAAGIMRLVHELAEATGALIMLVHHYGKTDGGGLRGASAFQAGADAIISVTAERDGNTGKATSRAFSLSKSRTGSEGPISGFDVIHMDLGIDEDGEPFGAGYVEPNDDPVTPTKERREPGSTIAFRAAFDAAHERAAVDQPANIQPDAERAASYAAVQDEYVRRYTLPSNGQARKISAAQRSFTRCLTKLPAGFAEITDRDGNRWICCQS
jgi:hypothetical protein